VSAPRAHRVAAGTLATALFAAPLVLGSPAGAAEDTVTYSVTVPVRPTDWTDSVGFPRFDAALGELRSVDVTIAAHLDATMRIENLTSLPQSLTTRLSATVTLSRPGPAGTTIGVAHPSVTRTDDLAAFDLVLDHSGASGETAAESHDVVDSTSLTGAADLTLFTGTGTITLPLAGVGTSVPPAPPSDADLDTAVGATVTLTYTYVSDTRPPDPPTIVTSPPAFTADPNPSVTFTAEPGATTECRLATPSAAGGWSVCTSPWSRNLTAGDDGLYTFHVRATDAAGNVGAPATRGFTLDRAAPTQPVLTFEPPALGRNPLPTWAFTIEAGATARCSLDGSTPAACSSPFAPDLTLHPDGVHTFSVVAVDAAGNTSPAVVDTYELDRQAPGPPTITAPPASPGSDPTPTWGFELATDAATATCSVDAGPFASCGTPVTADLSAAPDGVHTIAVRNADAAGNQSLAATATYDLDRSAPGSPVITSPPSPSNDTSPVWGIAAEAGAST
jgi:hypothetical protein